MKTIDILKISFTNLWRRKTRTILAIVGVFIGIFSILITVSIGLALSYNLDQVVNNLDSIRLVRITGFDYSTENQNHRSKNEERRLDDKMIATLSKVQGVENVSPIFNLQLFYKKGQHHEDLRINAVNPSIISYFGGSNIDENKLIGDNIIVSGGAYLALKGIYPDFDPDKGEMVNPELTPEEIKSTINKTLTLSMQSPYERHDDFNDEKVKFVYPDIKLKIVDLIPKYGWDASDKNFVNIKTAMKIYEEFLRKNSLNYDEAKIEVYEYNEYKRNKSYNQLLVGIKSIDDVKPTIQRLKDMGLSTFSPIEMYDEIRKIFSYIQLILGSLGAISLLVATIGITNTTIMTIYERTKEIGIMKVIGASLIDIRNLFLFESGMIGFGGGLVGVIIAKIISVIANQILKNFNLFGSFGGGGEAESLVSYIPLWLMLAALVVSTSVGLIAGYMPSRRAMKMSALASLRNE